MRSSITSAIIIALGLVVGGFLAGGRYSIVRSEGDTVARVDKLTGDISLCVLGSQPPSCDWVFDASRSKSSN
jgi:hypothetical protein